MEEYLPLAAMRISIFLLSVFFSNENGISLKYAKPLFAGNHTHFHHFDGAVAQEIMTIQSKHFSTYYCSALSK